MDIVKGVIERFLNSEKTVEESILHIGKIIVIYLSSLTATPVEDFTSMTPLIIDRISNCKSFNILETLLYPCFYMLSKYTEPVLQGMEDRSLQIFVDKWMDYIERGNYNSETKKLCLKVLFDTISQRIKNCEKELTEADKNKNICLRVVQIREYPSLCAMILSICRIAERQALFNEFDHFSKSLIYNIIDYSNYQESFDGENTPLENQCINIIKSELNQHENVLKDIEGLCQNYLKSNEATLIKKYLF